ncbi:redoxin domain-containing protein [Solwaraspora sp. WMMD406]|uniref:redoxin domain-containing protein n=1 Tax=Solwaraspora sp. WMMD406 TaxID=3016095 RepID=UPI0024172AFE|nr:redoxin domain-containing protein [Solwaraspora sp. WMMD406]MDG4763984.1 redoxin domain-containing protein [Solwaraspora sp. WMMD406]
MRVRRRTLFTLIAGGTLALAGCGADPGGPSSAATDDTTTDDAPAADAATDDTATDDAPAADGTAASDSYDFTVETLDGTTFDGRSLEGKPAVLWFWAPWCPTCLGQAERVNSLAADYAGKVSVVGVAGLDGAPAMEDFVRMAKLSGFPQLADEDGVVWKRFGITAQSTFVVLDAEGTVVARGHVDVDELPATVDELLAG